MTRVGSHTDQDIDMQNMFQVGASDHVQELEVNDSNFPALHNDRSAQHSAERVVQKKRLVTL